MLGKDESSIEYVEDRKGHDFRYSLDGSKLEKNGWTPKYDFDTALSKQSGGMLKIGGGGNH
nr:hypothetical protein [Methanosarcina horonobensis]